MRENIVIIGAGPAGLGAGYELSKDKKYKVIIIEKLSVVGGIARTISYKGNRMDLGGHRFFTKSALIESIWKTILPLQGSPSIDDILTQRDKEIDYEKGGPDPEKEDKVMLIRKRTSRIYYMGKFFDYPISLNINTIRNLGLRKILAIAGGYIKSSLFPITPEKSLRDFFINRFGYELYETFFKDYTQKVWGIRCEDIKPEWGRQRVKGLSIKSILKDILLNIFSRNYSNTKKVETSLIRKFYYPKFGPGQLWEEMAKIIEENGGEILKNTTIEKIEIKDDKITSIRVLNLKTRSSFEIKPDYVISTMAIKDLINLMDKKDEKISRISNELVYRDFITAGVLVKRLRIKNETKEKTINNIIPDNWIYLQDSGLKSARLQIFNNWSPYLISNLNNVWLGVEIFTSSNDELWKSDDREIINIAIEDLVKAKIIDREDFIDATVERVEKAYPAYYGGYEEFDKVKDYLNSIKNLYPAGRNGMHRYNNMDHSMLSAIIAAQCIKEKKDKSNIWSVNTEQEYHEER